MLGCWLFGSCCDVAAVVVVLSCAGTQRVWWRCHVGFQGREQLVFLALLAAVSFVATMLIKDRSGRDLMV